MSLFPPTTQPEQDALDGEREPQAHGLREMLPFLSITRIAPAAGDTAADGAQPNVAQPKKQPL